MTTATERHWYRRTSRLRLDTARPKPGEWSQATVQFGDDDKDVVRLFRGIDNNLYRYDVAKFESPVAEQHDDPLDVWARGARDLLQRKEGLSTFLPKLRQLLGPEQWRLLMQHISAAGNLDIANTIREERLDGFVEGIVGSTAHIRLTSGSGDVFFGTYPVEKLTAKGIREQRGFICVLRRTPSGIAIELLPSPERPLSKVDSDRIWREIDANIGSDGWTDDY